MGLVLLALASFGCVGSREFPFKGVGLARCEINQSYTEEVPYTELEYYTDKVPYSEIDYYSVEQPYQLQEPYTDEECYSVPYTFRDCSQQYLAYSATEQKCYRFGWLQNWTHSECRITNSDSVGGVFRVYVGMVVDSRVKPPKGVWYKAEYVGGNEAMYLDSGSSRIFEYEQEVNASICYCYAESISKREICRDVENLRLECHDVTKYRAVTRYITLADPAKNFTVTKYRTETKSRALTKYRNETRYRIVEETC